LVDLGIILFLISWKSTFLRPKLPYFSSYSSRKIARRASSSVKSRALELLGSPLQPLSLLCSLLKKRLCGLFPWFTYACIYSWRRFFFLSA
jgi:hypothetical protein